MQYCINALLKNNNEIMQYYIINNDIALGNNALLCFTTNAWSHLFPVTFIPMTFLPTRHIFQRHLFLLTFIPKNGNKYFWE